MPTPEPTQPAGPSKKTMLFRGLGSCMCMHVCVCSTCTRDCVHEALHVHGHTSRPLRSIPGLSSETQALRPGLVAWLPPPRLARAVGHSPSCRIPRWRPPAPPSPLSVHSSRDAPAAEHSGCGAAGRWPALLPWALGCWPSSSCPHPGPPRGVCPSGAQAACEQGWREPCLRGGWSPGEGQQWGCSPLPSGPTLRMGLG